MPDIKATLPQQSPILEALDNLRGNNWLRLALVAVTMLLAVYLIDSLVASVTLSEQWYDIMLLLLLAGWFAIFSARDWAGRWGARLLPVLPFLIFTMPASAMIAPLQQVTRGLLWVLPPSATTIATLLPYVLVFALWLVACAGWTVFAQVHPFTAAVKWPSALRRLVTLLIPLLLLIAVSMASSRYLWLGVFNSYYPLNVFVILAIFVLIFVIIIPSAWRDAAFAFVTGVPLLLLAAAHMNAPPWYAPLMAYFVIPIAAIVVLTLLYEVFYVDGEREMLFAEQKPYGSEDARSIRNGGRLTGIFLVVVSLVLMIVIGYTAARYYVLPESAQQPSSAIRWISAIALALYIPALPYRLVLLIDILIERSRVLQKRYDHKFDLSEHYFGEDATDYHYDAMEHLNKNELRQACTCAGGDNNMCEACLKLMSKTGCDECTQRRDAEDCWREVVLDTYYRWTYPDDPTDGGHDDKRQPYPKYIVMVAMYDEGGVVPNLVRNLARLNYPDDRLEIHLLIEEKEFDAQNSKKTETSSLTAGKRLHKGFTAMRKHFLSQIMMLVQWIFRALSYLIVPGSSYTSGGGAFRQWALGDRDHGQPSEESIGTDATAFRYFDNPNYENGEYARENTASAAFKAIEALPDYLKERKACFKVLMVPKTADGEPQTKPRALNYDLYDKCIKLAWDEDSQTVYLCPEPNYIPWVVDGIKADEPVFCTIYDAEDRPEEEQLRQAIAEFKRHDIQNHLKPEADRIKVACLQASLLYENLNDNWIISLFKAEYASWYNLLLPSLAKADLVIPLGGTSNHFKYHILRDEVGGWDAYNVTEDADLGIWFARTGYEVRILNSITWELADGKLIPWVKQRSRWIKGYIQTYFVHMRSPIRLWYDLDPGKPGFWTARRFKRFVGFQLIIGASFVLPLLNILFWAATIIYLATLFLLLAFGMGDPETLRIIFLLNFYQIVPWGTGAFFVGNVIFFMILMLGHWSHPKPGNYRWVVTLWLVYWLAMSWAAWKALYEFIFDPSYWEKSSHDYAAPAA
ncbi:MAG: glycosyltransferase family 2 protein [Chloroflexota bacterium]